MFLKSVDEPLGSKDRVEDPQVDSSIKTRFEAVAVPHLDTVYRMACTLARNRTDADDLVQETFVRAFRAFGRFELRAYGARPWLLKILHNVFYTTKGRRRRELLLEDADFDRFADGGNGNGTEAASAETVNWDDFDEELKAAVGQLQPEYRVALLLWSIEGLSYKEIAEVCDCALGTVMSRLYRARQVLGRQLREYAHERQLSTERFE